MYPYRFTNIHMFVQRVADNIVKYGYVKYVTGTIPEGKDPEEVDAKILDKYGIAVSRWVRARRKKSGRASVHYVRHQSFFAMFAPPTGEHSWREEEEWSDERDSRRHGNRIKDLTRKPLVCGGYTISYKQCSSTGRSHVAVRIHPEEYRALKAYYLGLAVKSSAETLAEEFRMFPFEPWAGVREQRWVIFQEVNAARKRAGLKLLDTLVLRKRRFQHKLYVPEFSAMGEKETV